jgi:hypothetical protein
MNKLTTLTLAALLLAPLAALHAAEPTTTQQIDQKTLDEWSAPYRGWHYYPDPVIPVVIDHAVAVPAGTASVNLVLVDGAGRDTGKIAEAAVN